MKKKKTLKKIWVAEFVLRSSVFALAFFFFSVAFIKRNKRYDSIFRRDKQLHTIWPPELV